MIYNVASEEAALSGLNIKNPTAIMAQAFPHQTLDLYRA